MGTGLVVSIYKLQIHVKEIRITIIVTFVISVFSLKTLENFTDCILLHQQTTHLFLVTC